LSFADSIPRKGTMDSNHPVHLPCVLSGMSK